MSNAMTPVAPIGKEFYSLSQSERNQLEALTKQRIKAYMVELADRAPYTTRRQAFDAIAPSWYTETGIRPSYLYNKISREFGAYLATEAGGPGTPNPFRKAKGFPFGPPPLARPVDIVSSQPINSSAIDSRLDTFNPNDEFTPFAALLAHEQRNASADFDSYSRDAHVRAFRSLINGSPQYGIRRIEPDAKFFGFMRWRSSRATGPNKESYEGGSALERPPEGGVRETRVVIHLRACTWHLEDDERLFDFPTLFQEAYGFSRKLAWLMACALIRAAYLANATALDELAKLCTDSLTNRRGSDSRADEKVVLLRVKAIWLKLCERTV